VAGVSGSPGGTNSATRFGVKLFHDFVVGTDMTEFKKLLVAKYSPQNGCNAPDGVVLTVLPKKPRPHKDSAHRFVSSLDHAVSSKYGWVVDAEPLTLDQFIAKHLGAKEIDEEEKDHIKILLSSIAKLPPDTPVAASYFVRGNLERRVDFVVHKVIFYHPKKES
jgi:hypothetical protein